MTRYGRYDEREADEAGKLHLFRRRAIAEAARGIIYANAARTHWSEVSHKLRRAGLIAASPNARMADDTINRSSSSPLSGTLPPLDCDIILPFPGKERDRHSCAHKY